LSRNYLAAALRNLARNKVYAGINIVALAIGFATAMLIALYVHDELNYDRFIPGYQQIYRVEMLASSPGRHVAVVEAVNHEIAGWLKSEFPSIVATARMVPTSAPLRHGEIEAIDDAYWADPSLFAVLPLKVIAGDLRTALEAPDGIVLTRSIARKYFGVDAPIGATLELARKYPLRVTAVLEDLPATTHLKVRIVISGRAAFSPLTSLDSRPPDAGIHADSYTYFRLGRGASIEEIRRRVPDLMQQHSKTLGAGVSLATIPIAEMHLRPAGMFPMKPSGDLGSIRAAAVIGVLIVFVACVNFVNLMTARAAERAVEVGIRKASGAGRHDLVRQFIGESLIYVALGTLLALAAVELILPEFNSLLDRSADTAAAPGLFEYFHSPIRVAAVVAALLATGVLAGSYPAFVLSTFRPALVLNSMPARVAGSATVRQVLVVLQFAILIGLILATTVVYRQTVYAMQDGQRIDTDQVLLVYVNPEEENEPFKNSVRSLSAVRGLTSSGWLPTNFGALQWGVRLPDGTLKNLSFAPVDFGFFEFYGLRPLAGRLFARQHGTDAVPTGSGPPAQLSVVINATAMRALGFATPESALGSSVRGMPGAGSANLTVIGVIPDFPMDSIRQAVKPTLYYVDQKLLGVLDIRLAGRDIPETLQAIDRLWSRSGKPRPIARTFLDDFYRQLYSEINLQSRLFGVFAAVAVFLACLGLLGLSVFTVQRRTKEIGIRKAMGASSGDILRLLLWQFTQPVLWANLIAWPLGALALNRWLHGFAYHVDLEPWMFATAGAAALVIAVFTVGTHCLLVSRGKPVSALRYE
jgi:putative ABC transport system permease protein